MTPPRASVVVFDIGKVLVDWDPRHLYRKSFADAVEPEELLAPNRLSYEMAAVILDMAVRAAATDDQLGLAKDSIGLYDSWSAAHKPVELHMYAKGGHGFGMKQQDLPTDHWIDRFADWLQLEGFYNK